MKETLDEAIKRIYGDDEDGMYINKIDFKDGAKWQQERSYSEEEMIEFLKFTLLGNHEYKSYQNIFNEWFEQFKKK